MKIRVIKFSVTTQPDVKPPYESNDAEAAENYPCQVAWSTVSAKKEAKIIVRIWDLPSRDKTEEVVVKLKNQGEQYWELLNITLY